MSSKVSILIPIYNVERFLPRCLDSLCAQTLHEIEIICIDDGSTDSSPDIIARYATSDPRIKVITKPNSGYGDSMNRGLQVATGEYVGVCRPEDWIETTMYETLLDAVEGQTSVLDIVKSSYLREIYPAVSDEHRETQSRQQADEGVPGEEPWTEPSFYLHRIRPQRQPFAIDEVPELLYYHPSIWSALYRRGFLEENGIRFEPIPGAGWADNPFFLETYLKAQRIVYIDDAFYHYREFEDGTLSHLKDWHIIVDRWIEMDGILKRYGVEDLRVLEGYYYRGCAYIEMLDGDFDTRAKDIRQGIQSMVRRMDYEMIYDSRQIPQGFKDAYQKYVPALTRLKHKRDRERRLHHNAQDEGHARDAEPMSDEERPSGLQTDRGHPKVSILVPIYNVERFLPQCLDSLCAQTLHEIEIICIDDGSTDSSPDIIARYVTSDPRIKVITKPNSGYGDSMNRGLQAATGEYIGICEPDDFADKRMFEIYYTTARHFGCDLVKSNYYEHSGEGRKDALQRIFDGHAYRQLFDPRDDLSVIRVRPAIWSALYRKSLLDANGIRFTTTPGASFQDTAFVQKCWICSHRVMLLPQGYLHYRIDNASSSSLSDTKVFAVCGEYASTFEFLKERGEEECRLFAPTLNAMRNDAYSWNYCRIAPSSRLAFLKRWSTEMAEAYAEGMVDLGMFNVRDRRQLLQLMDAPELFYEAHPDGVEYL